MSPWRDIAVIKISPRRWLRHGAKAVQQSKVVQQARYGSLRTSYHDSMTRRSLICPPSEAFCTPVPYDLFLSNQPIPPYHIKPFHKPITVDAQQTHDVHTTLLKGWLHQKERCNIMQFSMITLSYYVVVTYCTYYLSPRLNIFQSRNFYFLCFILLTSLGRQICQATVKYLFI